MKNIKTIAFLLIAIITITSCSRDENLSGNSVVEIDKGSAANKTQLDKYLEREFVKPYNLEIKYKLDDVNTPMDYNVVPPSEEKAIQMINLIKYLCLDVYEKHTPKGFLKENFPKSLVLVGSGAYGGGTVLLGTAAGGVEITLYRINDLDVNDSDKLTDRYFNTIFHEFSHILHQKKDISKDYEEISATEYVGDEWSKFWSASNPSIKKGFISNYASKEYHEDFVEMISRYMTLSEEQWKARVNPDGTNKTGEAIINKKLALVKTYLKDNWNISLDDLRAEVQSRYGKLSSQDFNNIK